MAIETKKFRQNLITIATSRSVSKVGDILFDYANNIWITSLPNASKLIMAIYQSSDIITGILFNIFGGVIADFKNRKHTLIISDLLSGVLCLALAWLTNNQLFLIGIVVVNILLSILSSLTGPSYKALTKDLFSKDKIKAVNSAIQTVTQIVTVVTPMIALALVQLIGVRGALLIDGITFIVSGLVLTRLQVEFVANSKKLAPRDFITNIIDGFKFIRQHKEIFDLLLFASAINFVLAGYNFILPFAGKTFSNVNPHMYAFFLTAGSIGGIVGASLNIFGKREVAFNTLFRNIGYSGVALLLSVPAVMLHNALALCIPIVLFELFLSMFNINMMSYVQMTIADEYLGRVFSVIFTVAILFVPLGTIFFSIVFNVANIYNFAILGVLVILITGVFALIQYKTN